jgi:aminoglycoside phosphotransferase (APT) family kinase protein
MADNRLAELRARRALADAGFDVHGHLRPVESVTNEVWETNDVVLRVNRRLHSRLRREAEISSLLPPDVPYPTVIGVGGGSGQDWVVLDRIPGTPLVRAWPTMERADRRRAVRELARTLRSLHTTTVPKELADISDPPQLLVPGPRAVNPVLQALDRAEALEFVDPVIIAELRSYVRGVRAVLDPFESDHLIHGDMHFQNVLWDGQHITALLDLEFARAAPPDLDLDVFLRFCSYPALFVPVGREHEARRQDYDEVPAWFREDYPELFDHPALVDRLRLYAIAFDLKHVLAEPPRGPLGSLTLQHPYRRLMATVRRESYLDRLGKR